MPSDYQNHSNTPAQTKSKADTAFNPYQIIIKGDLKDLNPISFGEGENQPGNMHKLLTQNCTLLFYSPWENGILVLNGKRIPIHKDELFVVPLGAEAYLYSTKAWHHQYIGFTGSLSHDFWEFPLPFALPEHISSKLYLPQDSDRNLAFRLLSDLYLVYSYMREPKQEAPDYVQWVLNKVNTSYMEKLSVSQMAQELGLNRSHLSRVFTSRMNMSIQEYILQIRISEAKRYLNHGYSITDTALLSGFSSRTTFSNTFLRETGYTPATWKKRIFQDSRNKPR